MRSHDPFDWNALLEAVRAGHPDLYRAWFDSLPPGQLVGGELQVQVPDPAWRHYLTEHCAAVFSQAAMELTGHLVSVSFIGPETGAIAAARPPFLAVTPLNPDHTFAEFVVGPSNRLAQAACKAICNQSGTLYNPLFIHGASGLGKTHLLQAVCMELRKAKPELTVIYLTCEAFVNAFVRAIETGELPAFRDTVRGVGLLAIDDVQFLANRESSQEELFHTFNALYQARAQVVLSADSPPAAIPTLEERLVSRFSWGLVVQIDPPNRETRQAILQKKARLRGCEVPAEVLDHIAERVESNIRVLEGALTKLITETQLTGRPLNLETAREILPTFDGPDLRPLQVSDILEVVSRHFGIRRQDLLGRKRTRSVSFPRHVVMYLARRLTPLSLQEIGMQFDGRDHSTVLHGEKLIEAARQNDPSTAQLLTMLTQQLLRRS